MRVRARGRYTALGMSDLAITKVFRGMRTQHSSGPQLAFGGRCARRILVMSVPITTKSPPSISKMSGQPRSAGVRLASTCGSGPSLRRIIGQYLPMGQ